MPGKEETCGRCGSSPATLYHCDSGTAPAISLCDDCLAAASPWKEGPPLSLPDAKCADAKCDYCGASPCTGVPDTLPLLKGSTSRMRWMCSSCSREYQAMIRPKLRRLMENPPGEDTLAVFTRIEEEMEDHMKRHIASRHN